MSKDQKVNTELEKLKAENELLKQQNALTKMPNDSLNAELQAIRKQGQVNTLAIPVKSVTDHKNIKLYTPLNKVIGPLHPRNAEKTMIRFHEEGIQLFTKERTLEQVEEYKNTNAYKARHKQHIATRAKRHVSSKSKESFEEVAKTIAKEIGAKVSDLTKMPSIEDKPANV